MRNDTPRMSLWRSFVAGGFALALTAVAVVPAHAQDAAEPASGSPIPGRYIIQFHTDVANPALAAQDIAAIPQVRGGHVYEHVFPGMALEIQAANDGVEQAVVEALRRNPNVRSISPDLVVTAFADTLTKGVGRVYDARGDITLVDDGNDNGTDILVAVFDTGIDFDHPDLANNVDTSLSADCTVSPCAIGNGAGQDDNGHGTLVAGTISAEANSQLLIGVAPTKTKLVSLKVLTSSGSGSESNLIAAMDYVAGLNNANNSIFIDVGNMSLGVGPCSDCTDNSTHPTIQLLHLSTIKLVESGTTVVVAAGNDSTNASNVVPAAFDEVVTVSAMNDTNGSAEHGNGVTVIGGGPPRTVCDDCFVYVFSNYGPDIDVTAPGLFETSLELNGTTTTWSGTSASAPHAAGVAALFVWGQIDSLAVAPWPGVVRQALIQTGECWDSSGSGSLVHGGSGCAKEWPNDPDADSSSETEVGGVDEKGWWNEPLVRADQVTDPLLLNPNADDLALTSVIATPASVTAGDSVSLYVSATNEGDAPSTYPVTLSGQGNFSGPLNAANLPLELAPGQFALLEYSWDTSGLSAGDYTLSATIDSTDDVDPNDNTQSATVNVQSSGSTDDGGGGGPDCTTNPNAKKCR